MSDDNQKWDELEALFAEISKKRKAINEIKNDEEKKRRTAECWNYCKARLAPLVIEISLKISSEAIETSNLVPSFVTIQ